MIEWVVDEYFNEEIEMGKDWQKETVRGGCHKYCSSFVSFDEIAFNSDQTLIIASLYVSLYEIAFNSHQTTFFIAPVSKYKCPPVHMTDWRMSLVSQLSSGRNGVKQVYFLYFPLIFLGKYTANVNVQ